ncbi:MAG: class I SAM-dependent methyltransferase [Chloroflexota bacterium]
MWTLLCPECRVALQGASCPDCNREYQQVDGIWHMMTDAQMQHYAQFIADYETVRGGEGRANVDTAWYRALPFIAPEQPFYSDWRIRAVSYRALVQRAIASLESRGPLHIIDLGAGNGWLSHRLAERGHTLAAVDVLHNHWDGLGAAQHYPLDFTRIQAPFDCLPLADAQADVVIYNGAFHYATDYVVALREALRVLKPNGHVMIMDSPMYRYAASGQQMVRERMAHFEQQHGTRSDSLPFQNFLTHDLLDEIGEAAGLSWRLHTPFYGVKWALRPIRARLRGHREPARFHIIVGERNS